MTERKGMPANEIAVQPLSNGKIEVVIDSWFLSKVHRVELDPDAADMLIRDLMKAKQFAGWTEVRYGPAE